MEAVKKEIFRGRRLVSINDFIIHTRRTDPWGMPSKERLFGYKPRIESVLESSRTWDLY